MNYHLKDLIDIEQLQSLQDRLNEIYSFPSAILDNDGQILTATGWQDVCTKFHRKNPECTKECIKSDLYIVEHLPEANPAISYRCPHGLIDNATPIIISGRHLGNFFTGQFFLEKPDMEFFREQAARYGFDERTYLDAVRKVPIWTKEKVDSYLFFIKGLIEVIANIGLKNLKAIEAGKHIEESEKRHRSIIQTAMDGFWMTDREGRILQVNDTYCGMSGYSAEELTSMKISDVEVIEKSDEIAARIKKLIDQGQARFETRHRRKDGSVYDVEVSAQYQKIGDGVIVVFMRDITERNQSEHKLRKSYANFKRAEKMGSLGNWEWNIGTNDLVWSDEVFRIYGVDPVKNKPSLDIVLQTLAPECKEPFEKAVDDTMKDKAPFDGEYRIIGIDGAVRYTHTIGEVMRDVHGHPISMFGVVQDVTERKQIEQTLRNRENFIRNILESVDEGFIVVDRQYRILSANKAFCSLCKQTEDQVMGRRCYDVSHHTDRPCFEQGYDCPVKRTFENRQSHTGIHIHHDSNGGSRRVEIKSYPIIGESGDVISVIETINDLTEKQKLEDQLRQAQKMEAIGTLAGGVAHDFNNILTAIIGYATMLKMEVNPDDSHLRRIHDILEASKRAAALTQSLLAFGRKQAINPKPVDLNQIVSNIQNLLARVMGEDIELKVRLTKEQLMVMADSGQIGQLLMNLAANARDAMPHGGTFIISAEETPHEKHVECNTVEKNKKCALITVSDTGSGIDEQTRNKIFEPFFTTKETGKGTGLGLAIVYGIVKQHGGAIDVSSEPGNGTTFKIYLPLTLDESNPELAERMEPPRRGTETILLAEDEESVRKLFRSTLEQFGYRLLAANDGQEALDLLAKHHSEIELAVLDVIMPKKSGKEVYDAIQTLRPDLGVLFISGYTADIIDRKEIPDHDVEIVTKPVNPYDLLRKIRDMLDKKQC